jgi:uncharacterized Zn finger protein
MSDYEFYYWQKVDNRPKSEKFRCMLCGGIVWCRHFKEPKRKSITVCNYRYCPYCKADMFPKERTMSEDESVVNSFQNRILPMFKAQEQAEKKAQHEFECPLCHGTAKWARAEGNRHLWIKCMDCDFVLVE